VKTTKVKRENGAPGEIRTPDLLLRRQSLYPSELESNVSRFSSKSDPLPGGIM
jgi:hypothetical protein